MCLFLLPRAALGLLCCQSFGTWHLLRSLRNVQERIRAAGGCLLSVLAAQKGQCAGAYGFVASVIVIGENSTWLLHHSWLGQLADGLESRVWRRAPSSTMFASCPQESVQIAVQSKIRSAVCPYFFLSLLSFCFLVPFVLCRKQEAGDPVSLMPSSDRGHRQLEH